MKIKVYLPSGDAEHHHGMALAYTNGVLQVLTTDGSKLLRKYEPGEWTHYLVQANPAPPEPKLKDLVNDLARDIADGLDTLIESLDSSVKKMSAALGQFQTAVKEKTDG